VLVIFVNTDDRVHRGNDSKCDIPSSLSYRNVPIKLFKLTLCFHSSAKHMGTKSHTDCRLKTSSSSSSVGTTTLSRVSACSTIVDHSQQEGFTVCRCQRHVKPPTWRRTRDLERSNFRHKRPPAFEATLANPVAEGGTMGEK
jgi:hypothetical protein